MKGWTTHAKAICIKRIPDHEQDHEWLINGAVWSAVQAYPRYRGDAKVSTWFQTIINNEINDYLSNLRDDVSETIEGLQETLAGPDDLDRILINRERLASLEYLTDEEQNALELVANGYSREETARLIGITPRATKERLEKIRTKLREATK